MIERIKKLLNNDETKQLILYAVFGVLTTLVNWAVYFLLTAILKPENYIKGSFMHAAILNVSNALGWILSVLFAFITNRKYVFSSEAKNTKDKLKEFFLFVSARVLSYLLFDVLGYNLCIYALNIGHSYVKIAMNVLVVVFNYFASRFVVFSKKK
ncbi:MAG: GtrA family protein [Christensenellaceae bacterium]|nr:GtrA family protein [Christensenellaceae bacterium]